VTLSILSREEAAALPDSTWPDVYFSPGYGAAAEASDGGRWHSALWDGGRIQEPFLLRELDAGLAGPGSFDASSPYGYAGIAGAEDVAPLDWTEFRRALRAELARRGVVSEFLRFGDLVPGREAAAAADPLLGLRFGNETVVAELSRGFDAFWDACEGRARTAVRKARKLGWEVHVAIAQEADLKEDSSFRRLYEDSMRRVGARPYYLFADSYYEALREGLGGGLLLARVAHADGRVGAAALLMLHGELMHYHLAGSERSAARDGANALLLCGAAETGVARGARLLHLGGGLGGSEELFRFKRAFGRSIRGFHQARSVIAPGRYDALVRARAAATGRSPEDLLSRDYFPAYRA
jgi:hypothetical protein